MSRPRAPGGWDAGSSATRKTGGLGLRHLGGDHFELVHPPCVEELRPDFEEGIEIWKAGEAEEARDAGAAEKTPRPIVRRRTGLVTPGREEMWFAPWPLARDAALR